jgi:hypothetical protein
MPSGTWLDICALRSALFPSLMPLLLTWGTLTEQTERTVLIRYPPIHLFQFHTYDSDFTKSFCVSKRYVSTA